MSAAYTSLAISGFGAISSTSAARNQAKAAARIDALNLMLTREQIAAQRVERAAANQTKAAQGSLARYMQSENNKRTLNNAGKAHAAATQTLIRMQDSKASGDLENQLATAEAAGAFTANAAFAGTGGSAVDLIDMTMRLKASRAKAMQDQAGGYATYDQMAQITGIVPQAVGELDMGALSDGLDLSESFVPIPGISQRAPSLLGGILQGIAPYIGPAAQQFGRQSSGTPTASAGQGFRAGPQTEGFRANQVYSINDTGAGVSYRLK